jgi:hypothetical protein
MFLEQLELALAGVAWEVIFVDEVFERVVRDLSGRGFKAVPRSPTRA